MRPPPGFTLLEVLLAFLVLTVGLLGLAGTLGPAARLAGEGRIRGRIGLIAASRIDLIRAGLLAASPACSPPAAGSLRHAGGIVEQWAASVRDSLVIVEIVALPPRSPRMRPDTVVTRLRCP
ncbi:MAG TPA: prepilin-type N-terminal cleavage/methylation domain-containing protein [Gemmatimonadales bacterium]|jgi:Tfp pilus assembly protein PilV|nr:prepilin-type N-terminal cleavage/methylation domain-containing protein [Gemmatimonadales bacterium]